VAGLALGMCLVPGCGFGGDEPTERVQQPTLLRAADVNRHAAGSPARALLEWWRAMQFDNATAAAGYYAASLRLEPEQIDRQLVLSRTAFNGRPRVIQVDERDDRATVLVLFEQRIANPNGRVDVVRSPRGFNLVRENGEWKIADNLYVERAVRTQRRLNEALRDRTVPQR
jgi:hypothetical protein